MIVDEAYLSFVREQPCAFCGKAGPSDPDHLRHRKWREPSRNDYMALPLCRRCHSIRHSLGLTAALVRFNLTPTDIINVMVDLLVKHFGGVPMEIAI